MAIPTLSGSYIDETYIRLVQVSGSEFADGLGNPISFGNGSLSGGINGYIPIWSGSIALSNSFLNQSGDVLKTTYSGSDTGLKIDFVSSSYNFGGFGAQIQANPDSIYNPDGYIQLSARNIGISSNYLTNINSDEILINVNNDSGLYTNTDNKIQLYAGQITGNHNRFIIESLPFFNQDWIKTQHSGSDLGLKLDFARGSYQLGNFNSGSITITGSQVQITGSLSIASEFTLDETLTKFAKYTNVGVGVANDITLFSIPTGSYTSAFGKYTIYSGSNSRAGELMTSRNDTIVNSTDVATNDIGSTTVVRLTSQVSQSYYQIIASFPATGTWDIKMMATYI